MIEAVDGFHHRVGHCGVFLCRASMHLYVPVGSSPEIGRIRPYKMGSSADVEEAERMYHCNAYLLGEPREEIRGLAYRLGPV